MLRKRTWLAGLACVVMMLPTAQAKALVIAAPPGPLRVANADLVVVGKVTRFGDKLVKAELFTDDTREMQIAHIKVDDVVLGKAGKEIKVGFFPPMPRPGGGPGRPIRPFASVQLMQDQEACVVLTKHPTLKDVYMALNYYDAVPKKDNPNFAKEIEEFKKAAKLLAKPIDGLKSKDADERYLTAALLIARYRTPKVGQSRTEKIDAEESKLILKNLADGDWAARNPKFDAQMNPQSMFFRLGVTPEDGWKQPDDFKKLVESAKAWLKDNADKYRIQRFVDDPKNEK